MRHTILSFLRSWRRRSGAESSRCYAPGVGDAGLCCGAPPGTWCWRRRGAAAAEAAAFCVTRDPAVTTQQFHILNLNLFLPFFAANLAAVLEAKLAVVALDSLADLVAAAAVEEEEEEDPRRRTRAGDPECVRASGGGDPRWRSGWAHSCSQSFRCRFLFLFLFRFLFICGAADRSERSKCSSSSSWCWGGPFSNVPCTVF